MKANLDTTLLIAIPIVVCIIFNVWLWTGTSMWQKFWYSEWVTCEKVQQGMRKNIDNNWYFEYKKLYDEFGCK